MTINNFPNKPGSYLPPLIDLFLQLLHLKNSYLIRRRHFQSVLLLSVLLFFASRHAKSFFFPKLAISVKLALVTERETRVSERPIQSADVFLYTFDECLWAKKKGCLGEIGRRASPLRARDHNANIA